MNKRIVVDELGNIDELLEKAGLMSQEIREEYLTGMGPRFISGETKYEDFKVKLVCEFNRYSTFMDIVDDYIVSAKSELTQLRNTIEGERKQESLTLVPELEAEGEQK